MTVRLSVSLVAIGIALGSCGGGGPTPSSGLKIFVTTGVHVADFFGDPSLSGQSAVERADDFCQTDAGKPTTGTYKALLVDGTTRDALIPLDWVLKPDTTYFQTDNDVQIATTTSAAIFPWALEHFIHDSFGISDPEIPASISLVWTGFSDGMSFAASTQTCSGWTNGQNTDNAPQGVCYGTNGDEWYTNGLHVCSLEARIYCAEQ